VKFGVSSFKVVANYLFSKYRFQALIFKILAIWQPYPICDARSLNDPLFESKNFWLAIVDFL